MNYPSEFYGEFGGSFIPEILFKNIKELQLNYKKIIKSTIFKDQFSHLLRYYVGRPTPLYFCNNLSKYYKTNIFLKREDINFTGAHKINNTIGQALFAKILGKKKIIAETGAGQHGVATATACTLLDLECIIFMGKTDMIRQSFNVSRMKMLNARIFPVIFGNKTLKDAVNESLRYWINHPDSYYLIGSVVGPHPYPKIVAKFQSIISQEIKEQIKKLFSNILPNYIIACVGGGSNAIGAYYHFLNEDSVKLIAVEAAGLGVETNYTASSTYKGTKGVIHGSMTLLLQNQYGQIYDPYSISAGLDYPGIGPMLAQLFQCKRINFMYVTDTEALRYAYELIRLEGIIPALESAHALACIPKLVLKKDDIIIINLSGRGDKDISVYQNYFNRFNYV